MTDIPLSQTGVDRRARARNAAISNLVLAAFGAIVLTFIQMSAAVESGIPNADDLMRMVQVDDLLGGQGFYDLMQYRLGLDGGTVMHWSRLIDLPLAALVWSGNALGGFGHELAFWVWPGLVAFCALYALIVMARLSAIDGAVGPTLIIGGAALYTLGIYAPGSFDHHNVQVALLLWVVACLFPSKDRAPKMVPAAILCVAMLAIGMEALPLVALVGIWVAGCLFFGFLTHQQARQFGTALALGSAAYFLAFAGPSGWSSNVCDTYSLFHLSMSMIGGAGLASTSLFAWSRGQIAAGLIMTGAAAIAVLLALFPHCTADPALGIDPLVRQFWFDGVIETRSVFEILATDPFALLGFLGLAVTALVVSIFSLFERGLSRQRASLLVPLLLCAIALTCWQQRGYNFATALAIIPLALWVSRLRANYRQTQNTSALLAMVGAFIVSINLFWWISASQATAVFAKGPTLMQEAASASLEDYCYEPAQYAALAALPAGSVMGATDIGAMIITHTPHRALAGPYHRNVAGNRTLISAMIATPDKARALIAAAGVDYIADCVGSIDARDFQRAAPDGLQAQLSKGAVPAWLSPVEGTQQAPLRLYRVIAN